MLNLELGLGQRNQIKFIFRREFLAYKMFGIFVL